MAGRVQGPIRLQMRRPTSACRSGCSGQIDAQFCQPARDHHGEAEYGGGEVLLVDGEPPAHVPVGAHEVTDGGMQQADLLGGASPPALRPQPSFVERVDHELSRLHDPAEDLAMDALGAV
jgi:hypothetical protein